jgi:Zn-finger nucleic acid-binding protein
MVPDRLKCIECGGTMIEEDHHGVTLDRCFGCDGLWFDIDEIYAYLRAHPGLAAADEPSETDFRRCTKGVGETCTCCGQAAVELGDFRGIAYQRCTWCGGLFIGWDQIEQIIASRAGQVTDWDPERRPSLAMPATAAVVSAAANQPDRSTGDRIVEGIANVADGGLEIVAEGALEVGGELAGVVFEAVLEFVLSLIAGALSP